ncbi:MAG TPA: diguanylate cyclase [Solirubrobacteraceae bacterium]
MTVERQCMRVEGSWLCPTELDRSRVVDANARVRHIRMVGVGCLGAALVASLPWISNWVLIPLVLTGVNLVTVQRRITRSARPERVSAWAILTTLLTLGVGVALDGGPVSSALPWLVLPAGMSAARFRPKVVITALLLTVAVVLAATLGAHPQLTIKNPVPVLDTLALLGAVTSIVWALQAAELHHRGEAILDPLTGLLNRHALVPRFIELSQQARLTGQPVSLVLCDLDNFKEINDTFGHDRGDAVLRDIAYQLRKHLRSFELIYRLGGEEFLILLPGMHRAAATDIAERLRRVIEKVQPTGVRTTVSLGVSTGRGEEVDYEALFKAADEAMYEAKRSGRNRVVTASASPREAEFEQAGLLDDAPAQVPVAAVI